MVERSIYQGVNSFKIYKCIVTDGFDTLSDPMKERNYGITIAGEMPELQNETEYKITAMPKHSKYGLTYYVSYIVADLKGDNRSKFYRTFLETIVSENVAHNILEVYPEFVTMVLNGEDAKIDLNKIKGVKDKKFAEIKRKIFDNIAVMDVLEEYGQYELSFTMALAMVTRCNGNIDLLREKMQRDPYELMTGINGVGFKRADAVIMKVRPELKDSKFRLFSCADYLLEENENNGSTWMSFADLYKQMKDYVPEAMKNITQVLENERMFSFDKEERRIARTFIKAKEAYIAKKIMEIVGYKDSDNYNWTDRIGDGLNLEEFRNLDGKFDLSDEQMKTLPMVINNNFSILTGSAGMGKSSGAKGLLNLMDKYCLSYKLTAPTGAASEVLSNYTNRPASTIHRAILRNEGNLDIEHLICTDLLIVDEASMVNINLMFDLMKEVAYGTKVLLICDPEQLPAIGAGKVIHDLIESGVVPVNKLTKVYRFDDGGLAQVATNVRLGKKYLPTDMEGKSVTFGKDADYSFVLEDRSKIMESLIKVYFGLLRKGVDIKDIGIMSSMNVKDLGTIDINQQIQAILHKGKEGIKYGNTEFRVGDKVIQTVNRYDFQLASPRWGTCEVFNGNQGIVKSVCKEDKTIVVDFGKNKVVEYDPTMLGDLQLAYAVSVHKFQGSGCKVAIVVTPSSHTYMLNKNLLYTALTRSTERTIHFADKISTINIALNKSENYTRNTFLKEYLIKYSEMNN